MNKKILLKNILIPVGIFIYFPFAFYMIIIVWGGYYDMFVRGIYISVLNMLSIIIGFIILFIVTAFLTSIIFKESRKDKKFITLSAVPIFIFFSLYFVRFFK